MAKDDEEKEAAAHTEGGGKKKIIIMVVPVLLLLAGAGWWFFLKKDDSGVPEALPEPTHGEVVQLDPITINLAAGHYLKFAMALQPTATAVEVEGAEALDLAISQFSQKTIEELSTSEGRIKAKEELIARIKLTYLPEGTDLAAATTAGTSGEEEAEAEEHSKEPETKTESESESESDAEEEKKIHIEDLSAEEVIKLADSLTVQAEVYDLYITEFVMQ